ncbi:MAG TPA: hybrid sensor histidine kinase/response regulator, partial [Novosphingobium sp.]|nr:hybrid sensor histidine kinase/response regulator [Novosphingobium sp.]
MSAGGASQDNSGPGLAGTDWLAVSGGFLASLILLWLATREPQVVAGFAGGSLALGGLAWALARRRPPAREPGWALPDWSVTFAAIDAGPAAVAIIDRAGRLVCANSAYEAAFGLGSAPPRLPLDANWVEALNRAGRDAWREGLIRLDRVCAGERSWSVEARRAGRGDDFLIWQFTELTAADPADEL